MSERKVTPSRPEICPVHPTGDNKYSKPIFGFFRKRPSSKAPSKVEQEEMEDKENQSSSQQQICHSKIKLKFNWTFMTNIITSKFYSSFLPQNKYL